MALNAVAAEGDMMRYLSIYKSKETNQPPSPEHIAAMTQLI